MGATRSTGDPAAARPDLHASPSADERFQLLVEGIRDYAIFMLDLEGWITTWSAGAERLAGYAPEEIIGRHVSLMYPPEDRERDKPRMELTAALLAGRFEDDAWRVRKDGSRVWAHVTITPLRRPGGDVVGFAKVAQDLTARRQLEETLRRSEARLSGIIASAMDAIISVNEEQRVVVFNAAAEAMFRCPARDAVGKPLDRFIPERFRRAHAGHITTFASTGVTSRSMWTPGTLVGLRADGEEFPIEATISQVETSGQRFFTVILRDITERTRSEAERERLLAEVEEQAGRLRRQTEALEESNRELVRLATAAEAANRAKSEFLAMMSHELRTPLNAIGGYAQLLEMSIYGPVTDAQREQLGRIQRSGQHLLAVINNILNFARTEAGQLEYSVTDVELAEAVAEVGALMEPQISAKRIVPEVVTCSEPLVVRADADKLRQVLLNLLTNAIKFTPAGGRVWVECAKDGPGHARIRVRDTGVGIPAEKLELVFEPFVQLERSLTNTVQGTGLGLAISRDLARGMGGDLQVESVYGEGSTFTVTLPLSTRAASGAAAAAGRPPRRSHGSLRTGS